MTSIVTETANSWPIPNSQYFDLVGNEQAVESLLSQTHDAEVRGKATGRYNCHGLTFASRRTCIDDASSVARILEHDGYKEMQIAQVLPGDVVLYIDFDGTISHSGIVVEVPTTMPNFPKIVSKWGVNGAEFIHWVHRSPYGGNYRFYRIDHSSESKVLSTIILVKK